MSDLITVEDRIESVSKKHEELYQEVLRNPLLARRGQSRDAFIAAKVDPLLAQIKELSAIAMTVDQYSDLSDIALKWQVVFSSIFNVPRTVQISPPRDLNPTPQNYTRSDLEALIKEQASRLSMFRRMEEIQIYIQNYQSDPKSQEQDWRNATVILAYQMLEGEINVARQIMPESFYILEEIWLSEIKKLGAYYRWRYREEHDKIGGNHQQDYAYACARIRGKLIDPSLKASRKDFEKVKEYLETRYLTDGKVDTKEKPSAHDLVQRKAGQIGGNWQRAQTYVEMFYEHIIPAVTEKDSIDVESVLTVFQVVDTPEYDLMINCFEVALVAYFVDLETLKEQFRKLVGSAL